MVSESSFQNRRDRAQDFKSTPIKQIFVHLSSFFIEALNIA